MCVNICLSYAVLNVNDSNSCDCYDSQGSSCVLHLEALMQGLGDDQVCNLGEFGKNYNLCIVTIYKFICRKVSGTLTEQALNL